MDVVSSVRAGSILAFALFAVSLTAGCGSQGCETVGASCLEPPPDIDLTTELAARGFDVEPGGTEARGHMSVPADLLVADGHTIEQFRYADERAALRETERIGPDGATFDDGNRVLYITWAAPPRFFRRGRLIVFYAGDDGRLIGALSELLGPPFAGRR